MGGYGCVVDDVMMYLMRSINNIISTQDAAVSGWRLMKGDKDVEEYMYFGLGYLLVPR
jgi:hypothetical protein